MKHFVIEITYTAPLEKIDETLPEHRLFLQTGYEKGWLLMSGPQNPRSGGIVIARAPSLDEIQAFFKNDPYQIKGQATYRFTEFHPVKKAPFMETWTGED
jgi:uncharacterized protein YciI